MGHISTEKEIRKIKGSFSIRERAVSATSANRKTQLSMKLFDKEHYQPLQGIQTSITIPLSSMTK